MKINWEEYEDPYEAVSDVILQKYGKYGCCLDFIVRIKLKYEYEDKYREYNELLYNDGYDWSNPSLVWQNDWWEGEQEVELLGCIPIDELEYPYNERWLL